MPTEAVGDVDGVAEVFEGRVKMNTTARTQSDLQVEHSYRAILLFLKLCQGFGYDRSDENDVLSAIRRISMTFHTTRKEAQVPGASSATFSDYFAACS